MIWRIIFRHFFQGVNKKVNGFHSRPPPHYEHHLNVNPFGGHRSNSFDLGPRGGLSGPPGAGSKHRNRLSALGRLFKPWKWKRRKKSEKFEKTSKCKILKKKIVCWILHQSFAKLKCLFIQSKWFQALTVRSPFVLPGMSSLSAAFYFLTWPQWLHDCLHCHPHPCPIEKIRKGSTFIRQVGRPKFFLIS